MSNTPIIVKFIDGKEVTLSEEEAKKDIAKNEKLIALNWNEFESQRDRAVAYDPIPEQLDQIYHDIDGWKKRIKAVKDKYPKP